MEDLLIETLENLDYPVFRQGSLNVDELYPETFFTFWNNYSDGEGYYDNIANNYLWDFDLNVYSNQTDLVYSLLMKAKEELTKKGFIVNGKGHDVASDEPTHCGRGINVKIIENGRN